MPPTTRPPTPHTAMRYTTLAPRAHHDQQEPAVRSIATRAGLSAIEVETAVSMCRHGDTVLALDYIQALEADHAAEDAAWSRQIGPARPVAPTEKSRVSAAVRRVAAS